MTSENFTQLATDLLWSGYQEELAFPSNRPLLAHYTSIQTIEKILTNRQLWLSNPLFMNDLEELRFGMMEGRSEFLQNRHLKDACGNDDRFAELTDAFNSLFADFEFNHALNTYMISFSEHDPENNDGLLSMWRGYANGGAGAAIVFDTAAINSNDSSPLLVGKVDYASKEKRIEWINSKIEWLASLIGTHGPTPINLGSAAKAFFHRLKYFALFSKHHGFSEEREWRIVYMSDRDTDKKLHQFFGHITTNKGIEPKLMLPIKPIDGITDNDLSLEKIIDRIILGPSIASTLGVNSLQHMLRRVKSDALAELIIASDIPYRHPS